MRTKRAELNKRKRKGKREREIENREIRKQSFIHQKKDMTGEIEATGEDHIPEEEVTAAGDGRGKT